MIAMAFSFDKLCIITAAGWRIVEGLVRNYLAGR